MIICEVSVKKWWGGGGGWLLMGYFYLFIIRYIIYLGNIFVSLLDVVIVWMLKYRFIVISLNIIFRVLSIKKIYSFWVYGFLFGVLLEGLRFEYFDDIINGEYVVMMLFFRWLGCVIFIDSYYLYVFGIIGKCGY